MLPGKAVGPQARTSRNLSSTATTGLTILSRARPEADRDPRRRRCGGTATFPIAHTSGAPTLGGERNATHPTHDHVRACSRATWRAAPPGEPATLAGWIHRRRVLASVTFLVLRDRTGLAQVVVKDPATIAQLDGLAGGDRRRGDRSRHPQRGRARGSRAHRAGDHRPHRAGAAAAHGAVAPDLRRRPADAPRPRRGDPAPPPAPGGLAARERVDGGLPLGAGSARLHRDRDAQARRHGHGVGCQRLHRRLLRAHRLPRAEPAALQADARRGLRARLRGRTGLPCRAARHRAPPRAVHLARRRARLHPRPP